MVKERFCLIISLWDNNPSVEELNPEMKVYSMVLKSHFGDSCEVLCDCAWSTEEERAAHFWYSIKDEKDEFSCTLREYIERNISEVKGANPFFEINRAEFLSKWLSYWDRCS